ncbi:hypothetical protein [Micromonospora mirobrigensis]|uniref:Uncharacterized protein n=1 Tax=Micromonospora mirobrigensis TaxID=262898 RepID=A0A1C4XDY8_9ACTN|nr:hypothetical protein [Micromonospora mirobrigensis]SCF06617.1 hypothetical protein GA0070564_10319 [Micromonospora mirobrigensis]
MARDVEIDVMLRDKTGPGVTSVERNLKRANEESKKSSSAIGKVVADYHKGFSKLGTAAARWANSGNSSSKKFVRGLVSGMDALASLGSSIGGGLSKAISAAGPHVQVAMGAVLVGAAVAAAPAIAGAIVGGAALGGVVGGLIIASRDARVAGAFDNLKEEIGSGLQDAAKRFIPAALDAVNVARSAFRGMLPDLKRLFDVSATWVAPLTRSIGRAAQSMLSGITQAVTKAGPIIAAIGQGIEMIGKSVGNMFASLSDNGASMGLALKGVFILIASSIDNAGRALNFLVEAFEFFVNKIPGGKKLLDGMKASQDGTKTSAYNLAGGFQALASDSNAAAAGITRLKEKADNLVDSNISLREAQIASRNAISEATETLKRNGKAHGDVTRKGRENESALLALATAFNSEATAGEKSGISAERASNKYHNNRAALIAMAEKAGYSKTQAARLAAQLLKIPNNVHTDINADTRAASAAVTSFQKRVNNLRGKTVTVTVRVQSNGNHYIPGVGTQLKNAGTASWMDASGGNTTSRVGGPRETVKLDNTVNVALDGAPFYAYTARAINESERRTAWRQKVGRR